MTFNGFKDPANLCFRESGSQNGAGPYVKPRDMNSSRQLQGLMLCRAALCLGPWKGLVFGNLFCCIFYGLDEVLASCTMQLLHNGSLQWGWELIGRVEWKHALFFFLYGLGCSPPSNYFQVGVKALLLASESSKVMRFGLELWVLARWHMFSVWFLLSELEHVEVVSHCHRALGSETMTNALWCQKWGYKDYPQ